MLEPARFPSIAPALQQLAEKVKGSQDADSWIDGDRSLLSAVLEEQVACLGLAVSPKLGEGEA
jgi:hypothetical protein